MLADPSCHGHAGVVDPIATGGIHRRDHLAAMVPSVAGVTVLMREKCRAEPVELCANAGGTSGSERRGTVTTAENVIASSVVVQVPAASRRQRQLMFQRVRPSTRWSFGSVGRAASIERRIVATLRPLTG